MKQILAKLFLLLAFVGVSTAMAQEVTGVVKDEKGELLPGVSVQVAGGSNGTSTNINGEFKIVVKNANAATLKFSFVGMEPQDVAVKGQKHLAIVLKPSAVQLEEVVAIGYGIQRKRDITGSVASVKADAIASIPVSSALEALSGKMAGVQITTTEGSPDADLKIRVRGGGSITGDNTPLFIVDGFPVETISDIAPSDIESIDVLKDASSTAIYGSRGANGVVIVTTKRGSEGKFKVNYNAYYGVKKIAKTYDVLDSYDFVKWQYEYALLSDKMDSYNTYLGNYQDMDLYAGIKGNDWEKQIVGRIGSTVNHNLSVSGGGEKVNYLFSYNHYKDKAIMYGSDFKRNNFSLKVNHKPFKSLSFDYSFRYSDTKVNGGGVNEQREVSSADSRLKNIIIYTPIPLSFSGGADNTDEESFGGLVNPYTAMNDNDREQRKVNYNASASAAWVAFKNFTIKSEVGIDVNKDKDARFYGGSTYYSLNNTSSINQGLPAVIFTNDNRDKFRNTNTINYDFKDFINEDHGLNVLIGQELIHSGSVTQTNTVHGLPEFFNSDKAFKLSSLGAASSINNYYNPDDNLSSFFGRVNYNYKGRYILAATYRADGSSKFRGDNKWGYFPSAAIAWRISDESFMRWSKPWINDMKIRFSYGTAGNNNIPAGQMEQAYVATSTEWINGTTTIWVPSKVMANPDLKWETTYTRNIGLDYSLFNYKITGSVELYNNTTKDLLINFPVAGTGYDTQYRNMGETRNNGIEFTINWNAIDKKDYGLNFSFNASFNRNKINSLGVMHDFGMATEWASTDVGMDYWVAVNGQVGQMKGYRFDGRYEVSDFDSYDAVSKKWILKQGVANSSNVVGGDLRPGMMKLKDLDGNGTVDVNDQTIIGNANPKATGGFTINGRYKNFDIAGVFSWSLGNDVYNAAKIEFSTSSRYQFRNLLATMSDGNRWTNVDASGNLVNDPAKLAEMNANTTMFSPYTGRYVFSDWAVEDGSFLRLSTLTLGYTFPTRWLKKVKVTSLRVYSSAYNLFCLTNYSGNDPEVSTRRKTALTPGVDYSAYPRSRQVVFGVNLSF